MKRYSRFAFIERRRTAFPTWDEFKTFVSSKVDFVDSELKAIGEKLVEIKNVVVAKIKSWFAAIQNSALYKFIEKYISCPAFVLALGKAGKKIVDIAKFVSKAVSTAGASLVVDIPKIVLGLICSWKEIYEAGKAFSTAWKSTDVLVKYEKYGFFAGKVLSILIDVIVGRRRKSHRRRLI